MGQLIEYAKMGLMNIWANKSRSLLTMLGIVIGIGAVIIILVVGKGGQASMDEQFNEFATGSVSIYLNWRNATDSDLITFADIEAIRQNLPEVAAVSPSISLSGTVVGRDEDIKAEISSGTPDRILIAKPKMARGRYWNEDDFNQVRNVCVIDQKSAKEIFGSDDVVGLELEVNVDGRTRPLKIIGVTESDSNYSYNTDITAYIDLPLSTLQAYHDAIGSYFSQIEFVAADSNASQQAARKVLNLLEARHGNKGRDAYSSFDLAQLREEVNTVTSMFTSIIAAIAGISLLVGGIGVMNIMLVSVTERTREIGIRKALGAKTGSILFQFLIEAGTLTMLGGIIGIALGALGGNGLAAILDIPAVIEPLTVVGVVLFSSGIGLFFGIYPANKAAKLSPIEALRSE